MKGTSKDTFVITPASRGAFWFIALIIVITLGPAALLIGAPVGVTVFTLAILVATAAMFVWVAMSARGAPVALSEAGIDIRSALYGRTIPWSQLDVVRARVVDLKEERALKPGLRANGIGLPGYRAGWFVLGSGKDGLLFVSDYARVIAIPARSYTLLLSITESEEFLASASKWSGAAIPSQPH